jgi:hypothetical protein
MRTGARIAICGWLMAASVSLQAGTLNVRDFGAVADDKTNNTAAFSKCMDAIIGAGGGKMFIPVGVIESHENPRVSAAYQSFHTTKKK